MKRLLQHPGATQALTCGLISSPSVARFSQCTSMDLGYNPESVATSYGLEHVFVCNVCTVCLASSQGCPRHASNVGCNGWMKLPGSEQGFSFGPTVTRIASSRSSLEPRCPYQDVPLHTCPPGALAQRAWDGRFSRTDQWCVGRKGQASELCWLGQLLTLCPPKQ